MHIILTHEQADFDALGALLGAYLLNERAIPVLPRRVNRNVRAFLNLYGAEFPFVEPRDLPNENIETITLVDTQSLVTLKGMTRKTKVHIVDHHQVRIDLPEHWTMINERLGSCTTLLVEDLRDHNGPLAVLAATTLLLGIYEDTGSLTYASTTPRDVRAVAFLLEQGASLRIASQFLNPPLSEEQREIYHYLLNHAENMTINGQHIMIATADAPNLSEEISSIAHKLRDLIDPDALFLLVNTGEGVRLVARSTSDRVNVAQVASAFGGGGHERAAAALIHENDPIDSLPANLENCHAYLLKILPEMIQPSVTVGRIMSRRPLVISADTSAQEAAKLMQRYGYEGYPVVQEGKVVGLLTRRAVDRAISHKLNLPAGSLMDAGEITVQPRDTLDHLQQLMAESGWGQVPVVDPHSSEIIGIVTRTDLLKILGSGEALLPERQNLAERLEEALPPVRLALLKEIARQAHAQHMPIYIVGGFVRDLLLDRPGLDFDVVVEGDAIALARTLEKEFGGKVSSHSRFGTAKWQIAEVRGHLAKVFSENINGNPDDLPEHLDFISARTEFYSYPTALPTVERSSIKLDLHRRDFTINTLALRLDGRHYGNLYDYWGGLNDLQKKIVRVLHSLSFVDDPTRMLRAVRFEQRFHFKIEPRTVQLINEARDMVRQVSGDRLRHELDLIFSEKNAVKMLSRLDELGLLTAIHPSLSWPEKFEKTLVSVLVEPIDPLWDLPENFGNLPTRRLLAYLVWLIPMGEEISLDIANRLRFSHPLREALHQGCPLYLDIHSLIGKSPSRIVARLESAPLPVLYAIEQLCPGEEICKILHQYHTDWRLVQPKVDGYTLHAMGLEPGPVYRQILWTLRSAWLDGKINSKEQEDILLQQLIQAHHM